MQVVTLLKSKIYLLLSSIRICVWSTFGKFSGLVLDHFLRLSLEPQSYLSKPRVCLVICSRDGLHAPPISFFLFHILDVVRFFDACDFAFCFPIMHTRRTRQDYLKLNSRLQLVHHIYCKYDLMLETSER